MIRLVTGFFTVWGSVGSTEMGDLSHMIAFLLGVVGLMLMTAPVLDGTIVRLSKKI